MSNAPDKMRLYIESYTYQTLRDDSYAFAVKAEKCLPIGKLVNNIIIEYLSEKPVSEQFHKLKDVKVFKDFTSQCKDYATKQIEELENIKPGKKSKSQIRKETALKKVRDLLTECSEDDIIEEISDISLKSASQTAVIPKKEKSSKVTYFFTPNAKCKAKLDEIPDQQNYLGDYLSKILNEYASLPYSEREKIYCYEVWRSINHKIKKGIPFIYQDGSTQEYLLPYKILTSIIAPYNYVLFKTWHPNNKKNHKPTLSCKRLLKINKHNIKNFEPDSDEYIITAEDKKLYEGRLKEKDVMFIPQRSREAKVKLSEKGVSTYNSRIHMRPICTNIEDCQDGSGKIYTFNCSESQLEFYFFTFGNEAKVLKPERIRKRIQMRYEQALKLYSQQDT